MQDVISQSHANSVNYSQPTHFAITRFATNFHFTAVLREFAIDLFVKMTNVAKKKNHFATGFCHAEKLRNESFDCLR